MKGLFITFEGPEGGGKTTQSRILCDRLQSEGWNVVCAREPGGTRTGEAIREILQHGLGNEALCNETETLLFLASRAQLVRNIIAPALKAGSCVVCDRFTDSTLAYQGYARGIPVEILRRLNAFATGDVRPDLTILLDIEAQEGLNRLAERIKRENTSADRIERETVDFHKLLRSGYLELAAGEPERIRIVNAERPAEKVSEDVWRVVKKVLGSAADTARGRC